MKQIMTKGSVEVDKVRAKLPKLQFPFHSHEGGYLSCIEVYLSRFLVGFEDLEYTAGKESCINNTIKEMKREPKSTRSHTKVTSGPAKVSNRYAVRGLGVAVKPGLRLSKLGFGYGVLNSTRSTIQSAQ